ncbi:MAG: glycoside hydrolase family 32 protein [Oscillospiraceae bacterium]|jgi:fructan beta-fructosidase|nr:glycoside hydrolase family 32 protein [Oscillospiraceae bacterium]
MERPLWHFSAQNGWINDPNGLVFDGARWRLYAQHTPQALIPGPMHWLGAVSTDLLHWDETGIALTPDDLGQIYSGSAVLRHGEITAFFTHHGLCEQQSIAVSADGMSFEKHPQNPILPNPDLPDFRDPKVFPNPILGGWSMLLAAGDALWFYHSDDLLKWQKTGTFRWASNCIGGVFECPDLFSLPAPSGDTHWVLTASVSRPAEIGGDLAVYSIGAFDGAVFIETHSEAPLPQNAGRDFYAAQTFFAPNAAAPVQLAWASNWAYAVNVPATTHRGCMTLARRLSLHKMEAGLRLAARPVLPVAPQNTRQIYAGEALPGKHFVLKIHASGAFAAALSNEEGEHFTFGIDAQNRFFSDRTAACATIPPEAKNFCSPAFAKTLTQRMRNGGVEIHLVLDGYIAELFADNGLYTNTTLLFPSKAFNRLELQAAQARIG